MRYCTTMCIHTCLCIYCYNAAVFYVCSFLWYFRVQKVMRYHGAKGNLSTNSEAVEIEDKFDVLVDANDQILERAVCLFLTNADWLYGAHLVIGRDRNTVSISNTLHYHFIGNLLGWSSRTAEDWDTLNISHSDTKGITKWDLEQ